MAARLMPFYDPKTEEGRRVQLEVRLRKAREAEQRARQRAQSYDHYQHQRTVAPPLPDAAVEIDEARPLTPRKTVPTFSVGPLDFMEPTGPDGSFTAFYRDENANAVPISEETSFLRAWFAAGKEFGPTAQEPPKEIVPDEPEN